MQRHRRATAALVLFYALALVLPVGADILLDGAARCASRIDSCQSFGLSLESHAAAAGLQPAGSRPLVDAGKGIDRVPSDQHTPDARHPVVSRSPRGQAQAAASTDEHRAALPRLRSAHNGSAASPPRAPPAPNISR
jgi:hypothetical protein